MSSIMDERVTDEIEALEAILMDDVVIKRVGDVPHTIETVLHPSTGDDIDQQYVCATLIVKLTPGYPDTSPEVTLRNPRGLDDEILANIYLQIREKLADCIGQPVVFELIELIRECLTESNLPSGQCMICLFGFTKGDIFIRTECYHYFHSHCLALHLLSSRQYYFEEMEKLPLWQQMNRAPFKTGVLIMELPNAYDRYTYIKVNDYCIDYSLDPKTNKTTVPEYRVVLPINDNQGNLESKAYVAMMISCFFMMLVLIVYSLLKRLRNLSGLVLMSYISSLFIAFALLIDLQMNPSTKEKCLMLTLGIYYFFLASFCWMNVMSFDIWWGVRRPTQMSTFSRRKKLSRFLKYSLYAWGVPLCMTIFFVVVNSVDMSDYPWFVTPGVPDRGCFLLGGVKLLYLYYPLLILNFCNWLFFVMTLLGFLSHNRRTNVLDTAAAGSQQKHRQLKNQLILYSKLYVVMGLNWVLEVISFMYPDIKLLWQITDYYNILIGVSIFIIFVCKKKVLEESQRCLGTKLRGLHSSFVNFRSKEANPSSVSMSVRPTSQTHHYSAMPETAV